MCGNRIGSRNDKPLGDYDLVFISFNGPFDPLNHRQCDLSEVPHQLGVFIRFGGQLSSNNEHLPLDSQKSCLNIPILAQGSCDADGRDSFINRPVGLDPRAALRNPPAVEQIGLSIVPSFGKPLHRLQSLHFLNDRSNNLMYLLQPCVVVINSSRPSTLRQDRRSQARNSFSVVHSFASRFSLC